MVRLARPGRRSHRYSATALLYWDGEGRRGARRRSTKRPGKSKCKQTKTACEIATRTRFLRLLFGTPGKLFYNLGVKRAVVTFKNTWSRLSSGWIWIIFLWNRFCCGFKQTLQVTYIKCMGVYSKVKRLKNLKTVITDSKFYFDFPLSNQNKDFIEDQLAKRR